jgi:hypothetical protein
MVLSYKGKIFFFTGDERAARPLIAIYIIFAA